MSNAYCSDVVIENGCFCQNDDSILRIVSAVNNFHEIHESFAQYKTICREVNYIFRNIYFYFLGRHPSDTRHDAFLHPIYLRSLFVKKHSIFEEK